MGGGQHAGIFAKAGKKVSACDYGRSVNFKVDRFENVIIGDFNELEFPEQYDCVWCSMVLEHQVNVQMFLEKVHSVLKEGGVLAVTVPPLKNTIVGGHVSLWNAGLLLYRLVLAGFDCRDAAVRTYGYNISVIVKKKTIKVLDKITYDSGDLKILRKYFPEKIKWKKAGRDVPFYGKIRKLNW